MTSLPISASHPVPSSSAARSARLVRTAAARRSSLRAGRTAQVDAAHTPPDLLRRSSASLLLAVAVGGLLLATLLPEALWRPLGGPATRILFHGATLAGLLGLWLQMQRHAARQAGGAELRSDEVTGLPTRRGLLDSLQVRLQGQPDGRRGGSPGPENRGPGYRPDLRHWSALLIEIDTPRPGTEADDHLLRAVASALRQEVRRDDLLGRWEGPVFVALLPGTAFEGALVVAERLRRAVSLQPFSEAGGGAAAGPEVGRVTVSIGAATCQPGESSERTLTRAELGLLQARQGGHNRVAYIA